MADANVLKEFLVSLGFKVDPGGERRFLDSVGAATVKVAALGAATVAAAGAVVAGVARIADNLEQLYFASKRTNASVENLQATGFAAKQMGVDAAAALGSVESLARFLRNSPGGEGLLKNLGVNTRDAKGAMRDTVELMGELGDKFKDMPYYKAHAFAQALGIDERTLMAMREGMGGFQQQYKEMLSAAGVDSQEAAKSSHEFMTELRLLGASFGILTQKAAASLTGSLSVTIRRTREMFVANFDRIIVVLGSVTDLVGRLVSAIASLAMRGAQALGWLVDWFRNLSPAGQTFVEVLGAMLIAWRALNAGFLATPLGIVVALAASIAALVDDYMTWKEGGKSLIDWSQWAPGIEEALAGMKELGAALGELGGILYKIFKPALVAIGDLLGGAIKTGFANMLDLVTLLTDVLTGKWEKAGEKARAIMNRTVDYAKKSASTMFDGLVKSGENLGASMADGRAPAPAPKPAPAAPAAPGAPAAVPNKNDPRGIRNFNPGNINYGDWARQHGATGVEAGPGGRFATFANAQAGLNALAELLRGKGYIGGGRDTVAGILEKYAPRKDNNDTDMYIRMVAKRLGVAPDAHLDPRNLQQMTSLIDGIVRVENGKNPYSREMLERAAAKSAPGGVTQTTTINVHGGGDAKGVAQDVARAQNDVNEQLVRNMRGAVLQ